MLLRAEVTHDDVRASKGHGRRRHDDGAPTKARTTRVEEACHVSKKKADKCKYAIFDISESERTVMIGPTEMKPDPFWKSVFLTDCLMEMQKFVVTSYVASGI